MKKDIIDFEDFFYTSQTIEADIRDLYRSWDALYQSNKKNAYIVGEYKSFKLWADSMLKKGAPLFGANTQVDGWKERYKKAYSFAGKKAGPDPLTYDKPFQASDFLNNPWVWVGGALVMSVIIGKITR